MVNMTLIEQEYNLADMYVALNTVSGNFFLMGGLVVFFVVLFVVLLRFNPTQESVMAAGFVSAVCALLFSAMNALPPSFVALFAVIGGLGAVGVYLKS